MDQMSVNRMLQRTESKLDNLTKEMIRHNSEVIRRFSIIESDLAETKRTTALISKAIGTTSVLDGRKLKQLTLFDVLKKPKSSPQKVDLTKIPGYSGGERKMKITPVEPLRLPKVDGVTSSEPVTLSFQLNPPAQKRINDESYDSDETMYVASMIPHQKSPRRTTKMSRMDFQLSPVLIRTSKIPQRPMSPTCTKTLKESRDHIFLSPIHGNKPKLPNRLFMSPPPQPIQKNSSFCLKNSPLRQRMSPVHPKMSPNRLPNKDLGKKWNYFSDEGETVFDDPDSTQCPEIFPPTPPQRSAGALYRFQGPEIRSTMDIIKDFDKIPDPQQKEPNFAYKPDKAIRKKEERIKLPGWDCPNCREYYEGIASQLGSEALQKLKNKCSRHRSKLPEPEWLGDTPDQYWTTDFPSTAECIDKGYLRIGVRSPTRPKREGPPRY